MKKNRLILQAVILLVILTGTLSCKKTVTLTPTPPALNASKFFK